MNLTRLKVSAEVDQHLRTLKTRTGLNPNILCRLGFCLSLKDSTPIDPSVYDDDSVREINRYTLTGEWDSFFVALLKERCQQDNLPATAYEEQFRAHINRGVIALEKKLKNLATAKNLIPMTNNK